MDAICPVCGFDGLETTPWSGPTPSLEICPSCGTQFGYDDASGGDPVARVATHKTLRQRWIAGGMSWSSTRRAPAGWDPAQQLLRVSRHS